MNINELQIGVIGGTGEEGRGLALRWAMAGARVRIGSRTAERAQAAAAVLNPHVPNNPIGYGENREVVAASDIALLTVPFEHAAGECFEVIAREAAPGDHVIPSTVGRHPCR